MKVESNGTKILRIIKLLVDCRYENMSFMLVIARVDNTFENSLTFVELAAMATGSMKALLCCHDGDDMG